MKIYFNGKKVAESFKQLRTKIKNVGSGITKGSIVSLIYPKGTELKFEVLTKSVDTKKKKGITKVNFNRK